ncbi:GerAB/ArcD/ProY family transporter [Cohnella silvisoli]|uniref:Endospore germination permease n=1 Tax=Cohnella silvisoli TaxID=2873699 RepID=A0ABV1KTG0_9BACL|nr:endospore germination permease [Cohnella silvisoli]MCD9022872.1 endospore germination permease [Cohnella silvisoli]
MLDNGKINSRQAGFLMFSFLMGSAILMIPSTVTSLAKQDGWLSVLIATVFGLGIVLIYTTLGLRFPKQSIIQYSEMILGKWIGKIVGLLYIWFPFHLGTLVIRNSSDYVASTALPDTPMIVISGLFLAVIAYGIRGGIETLGRVNEIILPFREPIVLLIVVLLLKDMKLGKLAPLLGDGVLPVLKGSFPVTSFPLGETVLFTMLLPNISNIRKLKKAYMFAIVLGGIFLTLSVISTLLVLGPSITSRLNFPVQSIIKVIDIADFVTNVDSFGMLLWISSNFVKIAVCYYCTAVGIAQWFRLSDYRQMVTPVGILMLIFSMTVYENNIEQSTFAATIWPFYAMPFEVLIPLFMLLVSIIRKLDGRGRGK